MIDEEELVTGRVCAEEGCENPIPVGASNFQKYCEDHKRSKYEPTGNKPGRPKKDKPPRVVIDLGQKPNRKDVATAKVEAGAKAMIGLLGVGVTMMGDEECGSAIAAGAENFAKALAELSKYQPMVAKIFAPTQASEQAGAWLAVGAASLPILIPVLSHHNMLPKSIATVIGGAVAATQAEQPAAA